MRSLKDYLINANYELDWLERPEGHSWGLWRATIDRMLEYFFPGNPNYIFADDNNFPEGFVLYQNYPNPFNPSTKISWKSASSSWQTLVVYDLLGTEVAVIVDEYKSAGIYEVEFNASSLPSGTYFYQLRTAENVQTKKMILLR